MVSPAAGDADAGELAYPLLANRDGTGREKGYPVWVPTGEEEALSAAAVKSADGVGARPLLPPLYRTYRVEHALLLRYSVHGGLCTLPTGQ
ncbi:hypothetical protein EJB05_11860, partial [Eragrostis curvula]